MSSSSGGHALSKEVRRIVRLARSSDPSSAWSSLTPSLLSRSSGTDLSTLLCVRGYLLSSCRSDPAAALQSYLDASKADPQAEEPLVGISRLLRDFPVQQVAASAALRQSACSALTRAVVSGAKKRRALAEAAVRLLEAGNMEAQWERQAVEVLAGQRDLGLHAQLWKIVQKTPRDWIEARLRREIVRRSVEEEEGTRSEVFGQWMREVESGREDMEEVERQAKKGVQRFRIWRLAEMRSSADVVFHSETEEKEFRRKAQCAIFLAPESVETQVVAAMLGFQGKYRPFSHKKPPAVNLLRALETRIAEEASQVTRVLKILAYAIMAHASLRDESKSRDFIVKGLRALKEWECENDSRKERLAQYLQFVSCVSFRLNESESKLNKATRILSSIISQPSSEFIKYVSSLELGRCLILLGKYAEAEQEIGSFVKGEYRHLLDRDCQAYSFCIYSRAIVFLNRNLFSEAQILTMARKPVEMFPQDPEYHMNLGMIYYTLGGQYIAESRFAYAELMQAAKLDFSRLNSETYAFLGLYHKTIAGNENIALRCFQTGYQINPSCRIVVKSFAEFCVSLGLLENANTILLKYSNTVADAPWCWSTLAEIAQKRGSSELEIRYLQNAIKFQSCNPILWARLSDAYMRVGKLVAALKSIDSAISFDLSTNLYFAFKKASILSVLGEKRKSIEILQEIERISTEDVDSMLPLLELHARLLLEESTQLLHDGAVKSAEISCAMLSKLISRILNVRLCSPLSSIWRLCGDFHLIQNVLEPSTKSARISAQRYFSRLVFLDPSSGNAWYNLGVTINRLDLSIDADLKMSTQCSLAAIKSDPIQPHFWSLLGMNLASVKARASLHCLLQAIELSPSIGQNWSILGHFLLMRNDLSHASSILKIAQSVDPSNSLVWLGNALLSYSIDQIGSAKEHLSQTVGSSAMWSNKLASAMIYLKSGDYREANCLLKDYTQQFPNHRLSAAMFLCSRLLLDSEFSKQLMIQKDRDELPCSMKYLIELTENAPILQSCNNGKKLTIDAFIFFLYGRYQNLSTLNSDLCVREILTDLTDIFEFLDLALLETINHSQLKYIESLLISIFARLQTLCTSSEEGISLNHLLKRFCTAFSFSKLTFLSSNNTEPKCLEDSLPYMLKSSSVSLENDSPSAAIKDLCRAFFRFPHQTSIIENLQSSLIQHRPDKASRITPVYPKKSTFPNVDRFVASIPNYFRTLYLKGKFSSCKKWISRLCFLKPNELDNFSLLQRTADVIRLRDNTTLENQGFSNSNPNELVYVDHRIVMKNARLALTNQAVDSVVGSIDILQGVASSLATINFSKTAILCLSKLVEYCEKHSIDRAIPILHHLTFLLYFQRQLKTGSKYFSSFSHYNSTALRSFFRGIFFRLSKKANSAKSHFIDAIVESEDVILKSLSMVNYGILLKAADFDLSKRLISSALVEIERLYPENELWKKFRGNFGLEILES